MADRKSDVLIIGGGPAGSSCAQQLRSCGLDVLVLDRMDFPRNKACAGWITPPVVHSLKLDVDDYRRQRVWQPISGFRCGLIGGRDVQLDYEEPISFGIRRCEFDDYLLRRSGARCQLGERVESIERQCDSWLVNGKYRAPMLVGAGGHFCPVARLAESQRNRISSVVMAQEIEFRIPDDQMDEVRVRPERPELFFCKDLSGYGWCFRKEDYLNIGLGRVNAKNLSTHVADFCEFLRDRHRIRCEIPSRFCGHAYRLYDTEGGEPFGTGMLLVGDSAGLAFPLSGEGIRPAVESGLLAANVIVDADGDYRRERLAAYDARLKERFGSGRTSRWLSLLPMGWLARAASGLMATSWFARHVVIDRWFMRAHQPALSM